MHVKAIKIILFLFSVLIVFSSESSVYAETSVATGTCGNNITWELDCDGVLTLSGTGRIDNTSLVPGSFDIYRKSVKKIVVKDGITSVRFLGYSNVTEVILPNSINRLDNYAFSDCRKLVSINIPDDVTSLGSYAFSNCTSLTSIEIPDGVTSLGSYTFSDCTSLTSIELPDGVTSLGSYAFSNCTSLTSIEIPDSVTSLGWFAFSDCTSLTSIEIPDSVTSLGAYAFSGCTSLTSIEIPDGVTKLESSTFSYCTSLTSIEIPDGVTSLGSSAFLGCKNLTSVKMPDTLQWMNTYVFKNCESLESIKLPAELVWVPNYAFTGCRNLTSIVIPNNVRSIGMYAFASCSNLQSITLPQSVNNISIATFQECINLSSIEIPNGVTQLKEDVFAGCTSLRFIYIPSSVNNIHDTAFAECPNLVIYGDAKSYSHTFALIKHLKFQCKTHQDLAVLDGVQVSCCSDGLTEGKACLGCKTILIEQTVIPATGHTYSKTWTVDAKASTSASGSKSFHCKNCGVKSSVTPIPMISTVTLSATKYTYNGSVKTPTVTVKNSKGDKLVKDIDYTVSYPSGRTKAGIYKVTVKFKGKYKGIVEKAFTIKLPAPTNVKVTTVASSGKPKVTWNKVSGANEYWVYRKRGSSGTWKKQYVTTRTSYINTSATAGTVYYYKVKAVYGNNTDANSAFSASDYVTCDLAKPKITVSGKKKKGKIVISWSKVSRANRYYIYRATNKNGPYKYYDSTNGTTYTNSAVKKGKYYYYKVRAVYDGKSAANSTYSNMDYAWVR